MEFKDDKPNEENISVLTVKEVAKLLGVSSSTICLMVRSGDLPSLLVRRRRLIPKKAFAEWLERKTQEEWDKGRTRAQWEQDKKNESN